MVDETATATSIADRYDPSGFLRSIKEIRIFMGFWAATARGVNLCLVPESAATSVVAGIYADSSTDLRELAPEVTAKLDMMLDSAREAIIEDGMYNPISQKLPELAAHDFPAVVPALLSAIESK